MRNLKKVLALALAVVMLVGMMVVGASAAGYADVAGSDYGTAIAVVSAIEALEGSNGNFRPDGRLTRADAAVIAARVALQRDNANKLAAVTAAYTDVSAKAYYAGAIAWATNEGILAGNGDGTFRPNGSLTGYAFAKMMLGVLGYDAEIEGYQNNKDYLVNINYDAAKAGLLTGLEGIDLSAKMTRGQAAQMAFNALQADLVSGYRTNVLPINGEWTAVFEAVVTNDTLLSEVYTNLTRTQSNSSANTPANVTWTIAGQLEPVAVEVLLAPIAINAKTDLSKLSMIDANVVANVNGTAGAALLTTDAVKALCIPGNTVEIYVDTNKIVAVNVTSETLVDVTGEYDEATETYSFDLSTKAGMPLDASLATVTFKKGEDADNTLYNALVALDLNLRGDKILVSTYAGFITALEKAPVVTGKATKNDIVYGVVTMNGVEYPIAGQYALTDAVALNTNQALYVDHAGNILTVKNITGPATPSNYVYVTETATIAVWNGTAYVPGPTYTVKGYDLEGKAVSFTAIDTDASTAGTQVPAPNALYTYRDTNADGVYEMSAPATEKTLDAQIKNTDLTFDGKFFAEDVTFFYIYDADNTDANPVVTLNDIKTGVQKVNTGRTLIYVTDATNTVITHVIVENVCDWYDYESGRLYLQAGIDSTTVDYYSVSADGKKEFSNFYVYNSGEIITIAQYKGSEATKGAGFYKYTVDAYGVVNYFEAYNNKKMSQNVDGKIDYVNGKYYVTVDSVAYDITDATVTLVDADATTTCGTVARLYTLSESGKFENVTIDFDFYTSNSVKCVNAIYVTNIDVTPAAQ